VYRLIVVLITLSDTNTHSVGLLWTRDRPVAQFATYTTNTEGIHPVPQPGFKPGISGSEGLQTHKLERAATAMRAVMVYLKKKLGTVRKIIFGFPQNLNSINLSVRTAVLGH